MSAQSPRIAFKAGRAFRRGNTNWVDPSPTKGAVILQNGDDGLLHFLWKNRITNETEEDLILFPGDATFVPIPQATGGRVYVLKFSSSDQRHFFWLQSADTSRDKDFVQNVNRLLTNPEQVPIWYTGFPNAAGFEEARPIRDQASTSAQPPQPSEPAQPTQGFQFTQEQLNQFQSIIEGAGAPPPQDVSLTDVLSPANLTPLFSSHPELLQTLFPHLPADLPKPPTPETLQQIVSSPQFRTAVRSLDQAFRTGLLGGLVRGLGLPEEAGTSVEAFLRAIQDQSRESDGGDSMDTD